MLKKYLINFVLVFCAVFACICGLGAFIFLIEGDAFMVCLCGLGLALTISGAITISESQNTYW